MIKKLHNKLLLLLILIIAVTTTYSVNIIMIDEGEFETLPEERKQKIIKIQEEFDGEISRIFLRKYHKRILNIHFIEYYEKEYESIKNYESKKKHRESFIKVIKATKIENKPGSIKRAIEIYEKNGIKLLEKAGYPKRPKFSLKIDTLLLGSFDYLSKKKMLKNGQLKFNEYYNGIQILSKGTYIRFEQGKIVSIAFDMFANEDVRIFGTAPKITSKDAFEKYLLSSKKIKIKKLSNKLCYIQSLNNSLKLCWEFTIITYGGSDSKKVYIDALTGNTIREVSCVVY